MPIDTKHWADYLLYIINNQHPLVDEIFKKLNFALNDIQKSPINFKNNYQSTKIMKDLYVNSYTRIIGKMIWDTLNQEIRLLNVDQQIQCYNWLKTNYVINKKIIDTCLKNELANHMGIIYNPNIKRFNLNYYAKFIKNNSINYNVRNWRIFNYYDPNHIFELLQVMEQLMINYIQNPNIIPVK